MILSIFTIIFAVSFNVENISVAGSLGFLTIFAFVNLANFKLYRETKSNRWISFIAFLLCVLSAIVLVGYNLEHSPQYLYSAFVVFVLTLLFELGYRFFTNVKIKEYIDWKFEEREKLLEKLDELVEEFVNLARSVVPSAEVKVALPKEKGFSARLEIFVKDKKEKEKVVKALKEKLKKYYPLTVKVKLKQTENEKQGD